MGNSRGHNHREYGSVDSNIVYSNSSDVLKELDTSLHNEAVSLSRRVRIHTVQNFFGTEMHTVRGLTVTTYFFIIFSSSETPCGGLPLLNVDGTIIAQSVAIARYLARECKLDGKTSLEKAQAD